MKQRIKLAQALVHDPEILFLDEPTNGMDPFGREEILEIIKDISKKGKNVLLSSHILPDVEGVCDNVILINKGELVVEGKIKELLERKNMLEIRVKRNPEELLKNIECEYEIFGNTIKIKDYPRNIYSEILKNAAENNIQIRYMSDVRNSLENLFINLLGD